MARPTPPPPVFTLRTAKGEVTAVHVTKGNELFSGHSTGDVQIWDLKIYRARLSWSAHPNSRVQWIAAHETTVLSYGRDGFVRFWVIAEAAKPTVIRNVSIDCCTHCPCDATAMFFATPTNDATVDIWKMGTDSNPIAKLDQKTHLAQCGMITSIKFVTLPRRTLLILGYENGTITVCDVETPSSEPLLSQFSAHSELITCLDFHSETMRGISGSADNTIVVWNMNEEGVLSIKCSKSILNPGVSSVKVHPNGVYVAVGGWDKRLRIFSWKTMKPLAVLEFHLGTVQCLDFVASGGAILLVAGSQDGRISLWDLYSDMKTRNKIC